jgi:hypothetical protein
MWLWRYDLVNGWTRYLAEAPPPWPAAVAAAPAPEVHPCRELAAAATRLAAWVATLAVVYVVVTVVDTVDAIAEWRRR